MFALYPTCDILGTLVAIDARNIISIQVYETNLYCGVQSVLQ